ncbi:MAG: serine hydrolase [Thermales bacterium]|nr:serine hydrolase [Thermales bacterium]
MVFIDLSNFKSIEINPDLIRTPGSVSKIPYAILTLKMVEQNKLQLDSNLQINPIDKAYPSDELWSRANGSQIPIKELLEYLIIESDNTAMTILENNFGGLNETNRQFVGIRN